MALARAVAGFGEDLQAAPEQLVGEIPFPGAQVDQPEVDAILGHAQVHPRALIQAQRLLEESRRFSPLAQILVDEAEVRQCDRHALGVFDAPEGGECVLEPFNGNGVVAATCLASADAQLDVADVAVLAGIAQRAIGEMGVAQGPSVVADELVDARETAAQARALDAVAESPGDAPGFLEMDQALVEFAAPAVGIGQLAENEALLHGPMAARGAQGCSVFLDRGSEIVRGEVQIPYRLAALPFGTLGRVGMSRIGGNRSMHS